MIQVKWLVLICVWLLTSSTSQAQSASKVIDSLVNKLVREVNDSARVRIIKLISEEYYITDVESVIPWAHRGLAEASRIPWPRATGVFLHQLGTSFMELGQLDSTNYYFLQTEKLFLELKDTFNLISTYNNLGSLEQDMRANYPAALAYYLKAVPLAELKEFHYLTGILYENMAKIKDIQNDLPSALSLAEKSLQYRLKDTASRQSLVQVGNAYNTLGTIYLKMKDTAAAKRFHQAAIDFDQKIENQHGLAHALSYYSRTIPYDNPHKLSYLLQSHDVWNKVNPLNADAVINEMHLGEFYYQKYLDDPVQKDNLSKAYLHSRSAWEHGKEGQVLSSVHELYQLLANLEKEKENYHQAFEYLTHYNLIHDSIYSQERKNELARLESQKDLQARDAALQLADLKVSQQRKQLLSMALAIILLTFMGAIIYYQSGQRKKIITELNSANQKLSEANKLKSRFFGILSHDLRHPVSSVLGYLNALSFNKDQILAVESDKLLTNLKQSTQQLLTNMEGLLLWSKEQMDAYHPVFEKIKAREYVQQFLEDTVLDEDVQVTVEINPDSLELFADQNYLRTILNNLVTNALKATAGQVDRKLGLLFMLHEDEVSLAVLDNGPGVPEKVRNYLEDNTSTNTYLTSFGITIIKELAGKLSAIIKVMPSTDRGTTITLTWPNKPGINSIP